MRNSCRAVADMRISSSVLLRVVFVFVLTIANVAPNSSVQDEGNACFDMAASIPGLQIISGNHLIGTSKYIVPLIYFIHWFMLRMHVKLLKHYVLYVIQFLQVKPCGRLQEALGQVVDI